MLFINFFKSFVNHWKEVWFEIVWIQSIEIKNGLAKSHTFGGMFDFIFSASRDQNKCTRKTDSCSQKSVFGHR